MRWQVEWSKSRGESPGNSDRKMNEFVTANESRTMTAHGIFNRIVVREENEIELTYTEFEILLLLARNAGIAFSKEQIYDSVWKEPYFGDYNIVMSHIRNIRKKIEDNPSKPIYIQTVWGVGYKLITN